MKFHLKFLQLKLAASHLPLGGSQDLASRIKVGRDISI